MEEHGRHILVIGNIGAGKTTAVRALANELSGEAFDERFEGNPYLRDFYADAARWAGLSQLWFLGEAAAQHQKISRSSAICVQEQGIYGVALVMTEHMARTGAIPADDAALIRAHFEVLDRTLPAPSIVARLLAPTDTLLSRIAERGRDFERGISGDYLDSIELEIERLTASWDRSPVLEVDTVEVDLRIDRERAQVAGDIRAALSQER
jgi:deoxyadenosine/deoxycytidine kinase